MTVKLYEESSRYDPWCSPNERCSELSAPDEPPADPFVLLPARRRSFAATLGHILLFLFSLWLFMVSVRWLSDGFMLLVACRGTAFFEFSNHSLVGLMIGVVAAALLHSSSAVVCITVASVGADILCLRKSIPILMGANLGTCVTCILVAFAQVHDRAQFQRAIAAATVHDMYNFWSIVVLFPLELAFHPLELLSVAITGRSGKIALAAPADALVDPMAELWANVNRTLLQDVAASENDDCRLARFVLGGAMHSVSNATAGTLTLVLGLVVLVVALIGMVFAMTHLFRNATAAVIRRVLGWNAYVNIVIGILLTFFLHSSTALTSTLTPLAGLNVISLDQVYPLVLGSNLGATVSGLLAAAVTAGVLLFYVVPITRRPVLGCAEAIGAYSAQWPMAAMVFIGATYMLLPALVIALVFLYDAGVAGLVLGSLLTLGLLVGVASFYRWYVICGGRARWHNFLAAKAAAHEHDRRAMDAVFLEPDA
ncbi:hypothetical protein SPRG_05814 [Saprolegnia parasitica CBS 223.65]|uniref:Sodium-dependent phosphate transporter n=1 Tax=Saprolegnia parasitica (strain CBS 223.65) TaxID=695850 RepID=A0A067CQX3_SAPPC|nr:hypothetical protein SPRG_05814 [Saprolegnia parasitica CBS 223.65]KDO28941.1 hypothetical protein SPRG_05814 [Saprolegnia parasitica CBS 223.65]|eukprot:XP_012200482.1 hypothetical protein SPRG_05814 [Saprolegnia parasitica CBS 223.65]